MPTYPLTDTDIQEALTELPGWRFEGDRLKKTYRFGSFREAISFLVRLSFEAEEQDHHPELCNVYHTVDVAVTTHHVGNKVTSKDVDLARAIETLSWV